jgi:hypothetical protein
LKMPIHNLFHKSKSPSYRTRAGQERAARQLCDQINQGLVPRPPDALPEYEFLACDDNGVVHELCVEAGGRVVPMALTQEIGGMRQALQNAPSKNNSQHMQQQSAQAPASVADYGALPAPSRKPRTPFANPFETEHKPLGSNGYRAYVRGQEALEASDFGERADDPRWSLNMMRARAELIRRDKEEGHERW